MTSPWQRCHHYDCLSLSPAARTGGATSNHAIVIATAACIQKYSCLSHTHVDKQAPHVDKQARLALLASMLQSHTRRQANTSCTPRSVYASVTVNVIFWQQLANCTVATTTSHCISALSVWHLLPDNGRVPCKNLLSAPCAVSLHALRNVFCKYWAYLCNIIPLPSVQLLACRYLFL